MVLLQNLFQIALMTSIAHCFSRSLSSQHKSDPELETRQIPKISAANFRNCGSTAIVIHALQDVERLAMAAYRYPVDGPVRLQSRFKQ